MRLRNPVAPVNFVRLIKKLARETKHTHVFFVGAQGQPIHKVGNLDDRLRDFYDCLTMDVCDVKTDDGRTYYFIDSTGRKVPDSPICFSHRIHGQMALIVRFPLFESPAINKALQHGTDLAIDAEHRARISLSPDIITQYGINIPIDHANVYQQNFDPLTTMLITQAVINTTPEAEKPKTVLVGCDDSLWAQEHTRYIISVLEGNGIKVVRLMNGLPIGIQTGLLSQHPDKYDMAITLNEGGVGRNFGMGFYNNRGVFPPERLNAIYDESNGIRDFQVGNCNIIRLQKSSESGDVSYLLPEIDDSYSEKVCLSFSSNDMLSALREGSAVAWMSKMHCVLRHKDHTGGDFTTPGHLIEPADKALWRTLLERRETTTVFINQNGSRIGLAEKVPYQTAHKLADASGVNIVAVSQDRESAVVHYQPYHIWTVLAALYADKYPNADKKFVTPFPVTSNIQSIGDSNGIETVTTGVGEYSIAQAIDGGAIAEQTLLFCEPNGNGSVLIDHDGVQQIERQNNVFAAVSMLCHFLTTRIFPDYSSLAEFYLDVPELVNVNLNQFEQINVKAEEHKETIEVISSLNEGSALGTRVVISRTDFPEVNGMRVLLDGGVRISMYYSHKSFDGLVARIFIDAPNKEIINEIKSQLSLLDGDSKPYTVNEHVNAAILDSARDKTAKLTEKNARTSYGISFMVGHPLEGTIGEVLGKWDKELMNITNGKFRLPLRDLHFNIGAMLRSQLEVITEADLAKIDFDKVLEALRSAKPFQVTFKKVLSFPGGDGNIVLEGEVTEGSDSLHELLGKLKEAGCAFKTSWPKDDGSSKKRFLTLGHINSRVLNELTADEARALRDWVAVHSEIDDEIVVEVDVVKLGHYCNRTYAATVAEDMVFPLGSDSVFESSDQLKAAIVKLWSQVSSENDGKEPSEELMSSI